MKIVYNFKDYTPIEINVSSVKDLNNLNILLNYIMNGATVKLDTKHDSCRYYFVDMDFEEVK